MSLDKACQVQLQVPIPNSECLHCHGCDISLGRGLNDLLKRAMASRDAELKQLRTTLEELQSRLAFLGIQFSSGQDDENPKGDVDIIVQDRNDEPINADRTVLQSVSSVFDKMFATEMIEETTRKKIQINDATLEVMKAVVKFCYCADISFTDDVSAEDVLEVALKYDIGLLQRICEEHLVATLNDENVKVDNMGKNRGKKEGKTDASGSGVLREVLSEEKEARRRSFQESKARDEEFIAKLQRRRNEMEEERKRMEEVRERLIPTLKAMDSLNEEIRSFAEEIGNASATIQSLTDTLIPQEEKLEDLTQKLYLAEYGERIRTEVALKVGASGVSTIGGNICLRNCFLKRLNLGAMSGIVMEQRTIRK